jgi:hypothetical protein
MTYLAALAALINANKNFFSAVKTEIGGFY